MSCCPIIGLHAQSYLVTQSSNPLQKLHSETPAELNLQENPFRWDSSYLQTLHNQKVMSVQPIPHINIRLNSVDEKLLPQVRFKCLINNESTSLIEALLELGRGALDYYYERWHWDTFLHNLPPCETQRGLF